jgi:leader peptidase (prepilin peptidase)/N-methyltransferase
VTAAPVVFVLITSALFAAAAGGGSALGSILVEGETPWEDGPAPVTFARWPFLALGALVGAASARELGLWPLLLLALVVGLLAACASADLRCGTIPDSCSLGALVLILGASAFEHHWAPALGAALVGTAFAVSALVSRGRGMGWGDVKLAAAGGALLGVFDATLAFTLAALAAYALARRAGRMSVPIAFGPYLAVSTAIALTFQRPV